MSGMFTSSSTRANGSPAANAWSSATSAAGPPSTTVGRMPQAARTFRIFVSSTFNDLKAERNALQWHVYPMLKELCERERTRFQAIDLRWGVSAEAANDQQTINICLTEVDRCKDTSPRPNFVVLLGNRGRFEIWNLQRRKKAHEEETPTYQHVADVIGL